MTAAHTPIKGDRLFRMVVVADTHMNQDENDCTSPFDVNRLANARTRHIVHAINAQNPDVVIHLGDLIHPVPSLPSYGEAATQFHALTSALDAPLHLVPGNHDVGDKPFAWGPSGTVRDSFIAKWEEHFGKHYYSFEFTGCKFIVINAQIINSGLDCEDEQRQWLEAELAGSVGQRTFINIHYPPYLTDTDENESYDNLAEPGRSWLLDVLERFKPEAMFAGHVHNFWYNRYAETDCYVLPSTAFVRQDYSEFYRVEPGPEGGRNDAPKLGFFTVDVYEHGHVCHMVRSYGQEMGPDDAAPVFPSVAPAPHSWTRKHSSIGLDLRQPWCEVAEITPSGALDEFERKLVRNDYPLLCMWEMGIRRLRVPLQDVMNPLVRDRMTLLAAGGAQFTVYSFELPNKAALEVLAQNSDVVHALEIVLNWGVHEPVLESLATVHGTLGIPTRISKLRSKDDMTADGSQYYHTINHGFRLNESEQVTEMLGDVRFKDAIDGIVWRCEIDDDPVQAVADAGALATELGITSAIQIRTVGLNPAANQDDEGLTANRATLASFACAAHPDVEAVFDSFADIDRGYFTRLGLVDRRYNPRAGWRALRALHGCLDATNTTFTSVSRTTAPDCDVQTIFSSDAAATMLVPHGSYSIVEVPAPQNDSAGGQATIVDLDSGLTQDISWKRDGDAGRLEGQYEVSNSTLVVLNGA
jgi:3',5'-cyclic AMP phosphodiesterase CpdA